MRLGALAIEQVSRFFALSFEIDLICAVFCKINAKALLTTCGRLPGRAGFLKNLPAPR